MLVVLAGTTMFTWLRLVSGSIWTAVFFHASHDLFVQGIFVPLTIPTGATLYPMSGYGIGLV